MAAKTAKKSAFSERVPYKLPRNPGNNGDVFVSVNGRSIIVKRGYTVNIPKAHKRVLERSQAYREEAELKSDAKANEFIQNYSKFI